jgi:hypothetical protein
MMTLPRARCNSARVRSASFVPDVLVALASCMRQADLSALRRALGSRTWLPPPTSAKSGGWFSALFVARKVAICLTMINGRCAHHGPGRRLGHGEIGESDVVAVGVDHRDQVAMRVIGECRHATGGIGLRDEVARGIIGVGRGVDDDAHRICLLDDAVVRIIAVGRHASVGFVDGYDIAARVVGVCRGEARGRVRLRDDAVHRVVRVRCRVAEVVGTVDKIAARVVGVRRRHAAQTVELPDETASGVIGVSRRIPSSVDRAAHPVLRIIGVGCGVTERIRHSRGEFRRVVAVARDISQRIGDPPILRRRS